MHRFQQIGRQPTNNRASIALRMAASTLRLNNTYLGAQFRRFRARRDARVAVKAMAAKLARLVDRILRYGMEYVDRGARFHEMQRRLMQVKHLKRRAAKLGYQLVQTYAT